MQHLNRRQFLDRSLLAAGALLALPRTGFSDIAPGVETVAAPLITGAEKNAQNEEIMQPFLCALFNHISFSLWLPPRHWFWRC